MTVHGCLSNPCPVCHPQAFKSVAPYVSERPGIDTFRGTVRMAALVVMEEVGAADKALATAIAAKAVQMLAATNLLAQHTADEAEGDEFEALADLLGNQPEAYNQRDYTDEETTFIHVSVEHLARVLLAAGFRRRDPAVCGAMDDEYASCHRVADHEGDCCQRDSISDAGLRDRVEALADEYGSSPDDRRYQGGVARRLRAALADTPPTPECNGEAS